MSQVKCISVYQGAKCDVLAGWDRQLRDFFLTVFYRDKEETDNDWDQVAWSTLSSPSPKDRVSTEHLAAKLVEMGIEVPAGFWERVERREGNVVHSYRNNEWREV